MRECEFLLVRGGVGEGGVEGDALRGVSTRSSVLDPQLCLVTTDHGLAFLVYAFFLISIMFSVFLQMTFVRFRNIALLFLVYRMLLS